MWFKQRKKTCNLTMIIALFVCVDECLSQFRSMDLLFIYANEKNTDGQKEHLHNLCVQAKWFTMNDEYWNWLRLVDVFSFRITETEPSTINGNYWSGQWILEETSATKRQVFYILPVSNRLISFHCYS